ncbi:hypothetical protein MKW98_000711, partial [Papaver atlanticum]
AQSLFYRVRSSLGFYSESKGFLLGFASIIDLQSFFRKKKKRLRVNVNLE